MSESERPVVLVTEGSAAAPLAWLRERAEVIEAGPNEAAFAPALERADAMVVRTYTRVDAALLASAPRLKVVGRGGVGLESIDVTACRERGVQVVYTPDANTQAVVELVIGLMVRLVRPWWENALEPFTPEHFKQMRHSAGEQLCDLRLGILGMGRVGRRLARAAHGAFGMEVIYHDLADVASQVDSPARPVSFDELLEGCDILSAHVDARPGNRHLLDARTLGQGGFRWLINTSRGFILDAAALDPLLRGGRLVGVALDVYDPEPPPADSVYAHLLRDHRDRVHMTPHMASRTHRALENMSWVVRDVMRVLEGEAPEWPAP